MAEIQTYEELRDKFRRYGHKIVSHVKETSNKHFYFKIEDERIVRHDCRITCNGHSTDSYRYAVYTNKGVMLVAKKIAMLIEQALSDRPNEELSENEFILLRDGHSRDTQYLCFVNDVEDNHRYSDDFFAMNEAKENASNELVNGFLDNVCRCSMLDLLSTGHK